VTEPRQAAPPVAPDTAEHDEPRVIAIDGPAGSGKSTVARELARRLGLDYLDTGAMYRSVAFAALQRNIDPEDKEPVARLARQITIDVGDQVRVDGYDATIEIRGPEVTRAVSTVAANPDVRAELRDRQRAWARTHGGGVVEGRDIGTVVFPSAEIKVFLTAADDERARRRHREVSALNYDADSPGLAVESIQAEMARRDLLDASRAAGPLAVADDAVVIDTTGRSVDDIVGEVLARVRAAGEPPPATGGAPLVRDSRGVWRPEPPSPRAEVFDRWLYRLCRTAILGFARAYWRLSIDGTANLPPAGAYVVAPVHRSNIDTPLIGCITRRRLRFLGKDSLWKNRSSARFFSALGGFPVHRGTVDRDALRRCIDVVEAGEPLVLFAEGTRQSGPLVHDLFEGAAYVALRTGVPIIPVGIGGSERAMPKGSKMLWPVRIAIVVGEPIEPPAADVRGSRRAVRELTAQLHKELQAMFDAAQVRAGA
jgi:cytidylate kinase